MRLLLTTLHYYFYFNTIFPPYFFPKSEALKKGKKRKTDETSGAAGGGGDEDGRERADSYKSTFSEQDKQELEGDEEDEGEVPECESIKELREQIFSSVAFTDEESKDKFKETLVKVQDDMIKMAMTKTGDLSKVYNAISSNIGDKKAMDFLSDIKSESAELYAGMAVKTSTVSVESTLWKRLLKLTNNLDTCIMESGNIEIEEVKQKYENEGGVAFAEAALEE